MPEFGLIGYPLVHSFSKQYFSDKFERTNLENFVYSTFPIDKIDFLPEIILKHPDLWGLNVTIPYKISVIPFLDSIEAVAREIGAVNTIKIEKKNNRVLLTGYNTDASGFEKTLKGFIGNAKPHTLILGTGGASKAVEYVLKKLGFNYLVVSRHVTTGITIGYQEIDKDLISNYRLVINTTPLGTFPDIETFPDIPYNLLTPEHYLIDLVYNPPLTMFLSKGKDQMCNVLNGTQMLEFQANDSFNIWMNR